MAGGAFPSLRRKVIRKRDGREYERAVVSIDGKDHYLGAWGEPESHEAYAAKMREHRGQPRPAGVLTVAELATAYRRWAGGYYVKRGEPTTRMEVIAAVVKSLAREAGSTEAERFGPKALRAVRQRWVEAGNCRGTANGKARIVVQMFRWAVQEELIAPAAWEALRAVRPLQKGREGAEDYPDVTSVPEGHVEATLARLKEPYRTMVRLQILAGYRPGELCRARAGEIDRSGDVWVHRVEGHKTEHEGKSRVVALGPKAQALLAPCLGRASTSRSFLFRSHDARARGPHIKVGTYYAAVTRAAARAGVPVWHPHQLRHNAATIIEARYGREAAQAVLGHASAAMTAVYVDKDPKARATEEEAKRIAREVG